MSLKSFLSKPFARIVTGRERKLARNSGKYQHKILHDLLRKAQNTRFGKDHGFDRITSYEEFKKRVPVYSYDGLSPYIERIFQGEESVLWPGQPLYFAKTSGTTSTSGVKYIPLSKDSMPNHINSARNALLHYIEDTGDASFVDGKMIFLSGSPELTDVAGIPTGRLSGLVNNHVPDYLQQNKLPSYKTNCIEDWETKLENIIEETIEEDLRLISGIPPWVQMYFDRLMERTGKPVKDIFPNLSLLVYGGVNFEPYRQRIFESIGKTIGSIETYPASEGFITYQDKQDAEGLLMLMNTGIFYEFIPIEEYFKEDPPRFSIDQVDTGQHYALVLSNNAGLWSYSIGDTVKFVSKEPFRLKVTGRVQHYISAFGEHVIAEEVENAFQYALQQHPEARAVEFSVAPVVNPEEGRPHHEWLVEFEHAPKDMNAFAKNINTKLSELNIYYEDLIEGGILEPLRVVALEQGAFHKYLKSQGKLGGQNKVPRLANDRRIADDLLAYKKQENQ